DREREEDQAPGVHEPGVLRDLLHEAPPELLSRRQVRGAEPDSVRHAGLAIGVGRSSGRTSAGIAARTASEVAGQRTGSAIVAATGTVQARSVRAPPITTAAAIGRRIQIGIGRVTLAGAPAFTIEAIQASHSDRSTSSETA